MDKVGEIIRLSASDLVNHLACRRLTELNHEVAGGLHAASRVLGSHTGSVVGKRAGPRTGLHPTSDGYRRSGDLGRGVRPRGRHRGGNH